MYSCQILASMIVASKGSVHMWLLGLKVDLISSMPLNIQ